MDAAQIEVGTAVAERNGAPIEVPEVMQEAATIHRLMEQALTQGSDGVAALRELVELHREVAREDANRRLIHAVAAFRAECPQIVRSKGVEPKVTAAGTTYKRHYAPLDAIERIINPLLVRHGLSYTYDSHPDDKGRQVITCTLWHIAGASRSSSVSMPVPNIPNANDSQKAGGAFTYGMRYALLMALGMATAEDDDGANDPGEDVGECVSADQLANLQAVWDEVKAKVRAKDFFAYFGCTEDKLSAIPAEKYGEALSMLERKRK